MVADGYRGAAESQEQRSAFISRERSSIEAG